MELPIVVVGLTGRARSGKDTFANVLVKAFGFTKFSHADPLKDGLAAMLGISRAELDERKENGDTFIRHALQTLGTEWGRNQIGANCWVDMLINRIRNSKKRLVVVPDVRFDNEAEQLAAAFPGFTLLQCIRPNTATIHGSTHASEAGVSSQYIDQMFVNDGTQQQWECLASRSVYHLIVR